MDFELSEEQRMLRDSAERFVAERYAPSDRRTSPRGRLDIERNAWREFAEMGWLALPISEAAGGLGGSEIDVFVLMTTLGRGLSVEPIVTSSILAGTILEGSSLGDRASLLQRICAGSYQPALAHLEEGERVEDLSARRVSAVPQTDGWSLSGQKRMVLDGDLADAFIVSASSAQDSSFMLLLLDKNSPGVKVKSYPLVDGSAAADVSFRSVKVPKTALIARGEAASRLLERAVARATLAYLGQALGSMETCLDICSTYLKTRVQFGQPIGKFQALQHMMVEMLLVTEESRSSLYAAFAADPADRIEVLRTLSSAKVTVGEAGLLVARYGVQLHGGLGLTDECEISHHYRRLMVIEKLFGDSQWHARRLADLTARAGSASETLSKRFLGGAHR